MNFGGLWLIRADGCLIGTASEAFPNSPSDSG
jgi:hypothetical protein